MIEVHGSPKGLSTRAVRAIPRDAAIMEVRGVIHPSPSMHSVQVGEDRHLLASGSFIYMNHSFFPNCTLDIDDENDEGARIRVIALRDIAAGEDLCFNYNTTEWELACPFVDLDTGRPVEGLKHATVQEMMALVPLLPAWLKTKVATCLVTAAMPAIQGMQET